MRPMALNKRKANTHLNKRRSAWDRDQLFDREFNDSSGVKSDGNERTKSESTSPLVAGAEIMIRSTPTRGSTKLVACRLFTTDLAARRQARAKIERL